MVALALERLVRIKKGVVPHHEYAAAMASLVREVLSAAKCKYEDVTYWIVTSTEARDDGEEQQLCDVLGLTIPDDKRLHLPHPGHHLAHASAAFYTSGFEEAVAVVIDAYGSLVGNQRERESAFFFRQGEQPSTLMQTLRPSSRIAGTGIGERWALPPTIEGIGEMYRILTLALGFSELGTKYDDAGKTMGLAPFGKRLSADDMFIAIEDGEVRFDRALPSLQELGLVSEEDSGAWLIPRRRGKPIEPFHCDLAAQIQSEFEAACLHIVENALRIGRSKHLVASGGCFLNSVLNDRILRETSVEDLFVFPAATDDGNSVGAALYAYHNLIPSAAPASKGGRITNVFWGPERTQDEPDFAGFLPSKCPVPVTQHDSISATTWAAASALEKGEIIGWFQGRSEFGPRALGSRSILCHPGIPGMKDRLNARVKFRESFRPFAASVLLEESAKWFNDSEIDSPFMLRVCSVREGRRGEIPEVVHVDGTCRVQTVAPDQTSSFRKLLAEFDRLTGLPMLLNTSLNLRGQPIAEMPFQALDLLFSSRIDRMFIGNVEFTAPDFRTLIPVRTGQDHSHSQILEETDRSLLALIDGDRSAGEVADEMGRNPLDIVDVLLRLKWQGYVRWKEYADSLPPRFPSAQFG